jgi:hypothetical protein
MLRVLIQNVIFAIKAFLVHSVPVRSAVDRKPLACEDVKMLHFLKVYNIYCSAFVETFD